MYVKTALTINPIENGNRNISGLENLGFLQKVFRFLGFLGFLGF